MTLQLQFISQHFSGTMIIKMLLVVIMYIVTMAMNLQNVRIVVTCLLVMMTKHFALIAINVLMNMQHVVFVDAL